MDLEKEKADRKDESWGASVPVSGFEEEEDMTKEYRQCLNSDNNPRLKISKEMKTLFYNHLELNLAHSQHESGNSFSSKEYCPANNLIVFQ